MEYLNSYNSKNLNDFDGEENVEIRVVLSFSAVAGNYATAIIRANL